jgi:hypothetical protein
MHLLSHAALALLRTFPEGILTVADELLQNNGQKFLEMMEQLADKRVRRDRQAAQAFDDEQSGAEDRSDDGEYECVGFASPEVSSG